MKHTYVIPPKSLKTILEVDDVFFSILLFLSPYDLCVIQHVSKSFANYANTPALWKQPLLKWRKIIDPFSKENNNANVATTQGEDYKQQFMKLCQEKVEASKSPLEKASIDYSDDTHQCAKCKHNIPDFLLRINVNSLSYHFQCGCSLIRSSFSHQLPGYETLEPPHKRFVDAFFKMLRRVKQKRTFANGGVIATTCDKCGSIPLKSMYCSTCNQDYCSSCKTTEVCPHPSTKTLNTPLFQCYRCNKIIEEGSNLAFSPVIQILICVRCYDPNEDADNDFRLIGRVRTRELPSRRPLIFLMQMPFEEATVNIDLDFINEFLPPTMSPQSAADTFWSTCLFRTYALAPNPVREHFIGLAVPIPVYPTSHNPFSFIDHLGHPPPLPPPNTTERDPKKPRIRY